MKFFGFKLVRNEKLDKIQAKANKLDSLFDFDKFKPELTYEQFCAEHNLNATGSLLKHHHEYWKDQYVHTHISCKIGELAKTDPHLLQVFLNEFSSVDWIRISEYMKKTNWTWGSQNKVPTLDELKYCVISLIPSDNFQSLNNTISSGGFSVTLNYINGTPNCKIEFEFNR